MLSYGFNTKALWQLEPKLWAIMWFWRHLWRHCDVQWRRTAEKNIFLESVGQDLSFGILLDMVAKSSIFLNTLTLTELFEVKVKGQGQGHNRSSLIHAIIWNQHEGSTTIRTGVMAIYVILTSFMTSFWRPVTSYGKKSIYLKSVDQDLWFDILLDMVERGSIFSKTLSLTAFFKVKVKGQGQGHIRWASSRVMIWT